MIIYQFFFPCGKYFMDIYAKVWFSLDKYKWEVNEEDIYGVYIVLKRRVRSFYNSLLRIFLYT